MTRSEIDYNLELDSLSNQVINAAEERDRGIRELESLEAEVETDVSITDILEAEIKELKAKAEADAEEPKQLSEVAKRVDREEKLKAELDDHRRQ